MCIPSAVLIAHYYGCTYFQTISISQTYLFPTFVIVFVMDIDQWEQIEKFRQLKLSITLQKAVTIIETRWMKRI